MVERNVSKLKQIAKISADRAARQDAESQTVSGRRALKDDQPAKLLAKHIEGLRPLSREYDALMARRAAKLESEINHSRARASRLGRGRKAALANMTKQRVKAFEALIGAVQVPSARRYLVNTPFEIAARTFTLDSSAIVPSNSWAKFKADVVKTRYYAVTGAVIFRFVWVNTSDKYAVINANGYIILNGFCDVASRGGIFGGDRRAGVTATPTFQMIDWTTEPYPIFGKQEVEAFKIATNTGYTWDDADSESIDVFRGYDLGLSLILVPPETAVGLVMSLEMKLAAGVDSGRARADFSTGAFLVGSPAVLITVVS